MELKEVLGALEKRKDLREWLIKKGPWFVRMMREKKELSVNKFARAYDKSPGLISRIERGMSIIGRDFAMQLLSEYLEGLDNE